MTSTDVSIADKDKFSGGRGKASVSFQIFDTAVKARLVNRDIDHILVDTDPNLRPQRTADVMMADPDGVIDPATGNVRQVVKLRKETAAQYNALKKSWASDDNKVKSVLTLCTKGEANQIVTNVRAPSGKTAYGKLVERYGCTSVAPWCA